MELFGSWAFPAKIRFGAGRVSEIPEACREIGAERPLLVTDPGLARQPMVEDAATDCAASGLQIAVFSGIKPNPTGENVENGAAAYRSGDHDCVIAFGGGSALDAAKAIALVAKQSRPIWDFEDVGDNWLRADASRIAPTIAVPTTAGTGSEVGRASVITDTDHATKRIIFHPRMLPELVIADPELTVGLPPHLTAATGMDALSHNLEAFCAPGYHPMARGIAVEGIRLIKTWLVRAVTDGSDIEARSHMLAASMMGATAFQRGLGAMHALAHPLGALFDAHHGLLNAILMPYVLKANLHEISGELDELARAMGLGSAAGVVDWVLALREEIGIPPSLADIGIDDARSTEVGAAAFKDPSAATNPISFTEEEYAQLFARAVRGDD